MEKHPKSAYADHRQVFTADACNNYSTYPQYMVIHLPLEPAKKASICFTDLWLRL